MVPNLLAAARPRRSMIERSIGFLQDVTNLENPDGLPLTLEDRIEIAQYTLGLWKELVAELKAMR